MRKLHKNTAGLLLLVTIMTVGMPATALAGPCQDRFHQDLVLCEEMFPLWWQSAARGFCDALALGDFSLCIAEAAAQ